VSREARGDRPVDGLVVNPCRDSPELLEVLPRLPTALLDATVKMKSLQRNVARQQREIAELRARQKTDARNRRTHSASLVLLVVAIVVLWNMQQS